MQKEGSGSKDKPKTVSFRQVLKSGFIPITPEILHRIKHEMERTGVSPRSLAAPSGYDGDFTFIYKMLCGVQKSVNEEKLNLIYELYAKLPNKSDHSRKRPVRAGYASVTPGIIDEIKDHMERTGLDISSFLKENDLEYMGVQNVRGWVNKHIKSAPEEHVKKLLSEWARVPDHFYVQITPAMSDFVNKEIERTGRGVMSILRGNKIAKEAGITSSQIRSVINCRSKNMKAEMLDLILNLWADKPDKATDKSIDKPDDKIRWNKTLAAKLNQRAASTRIPPNKFLDGRSDIPDGLDKEMFITLITGRYSRDVKKTYIDR